ncbi:hypothetical protein CAI21_12275 [Alkalilimnicola ehrlichii]|uniref:Sigma E regulatory protein, MucB/RseB n=1 Tax=Alkalilimnicola ehrlichii TaxID=351052 RepID=A0A3E0X2X2_9GAMM|nr:MucB/RseB C-terminal domain-containing protein [Alkalilimnicola ehrlichii]RFA28351.1 hypothetical protein CAI21_12275 [Alkalilimnicola ehrlichii]RFA38584.1 hypothetical protein CAL65_04385 [Alkalilimnicola ehrlichii]
MSDKRRFALMGLLSGLLFSMAGVGWAAQAEEAQHLLERMTQAAKNLNYKGTFVYNHQGKLETMRLIHRADEDGVQERLYSLTGTPREIIRDNEKVTCILPEDQAVRIDWLQNGNPFSELMPADVAPLREHYEFSLQGQDRIADRVAKVVAILPRDEYRYGYRLWMDVDNGLLLRSDLLNESGETVEQLLFTELVVFDSIPDDWLKPGIAGDDFVLYQLERKENSSDTAKPGWQAAGLPPGFKLREHRLRQLSGRQGSVEHFLYSDGLATVSAYIENAAPEQAFTGVSRVGAVSAFGRWEEGVQLTVVGEVPARTVTRIGNSLNPADN